MNRTAWTDDEQHLADALQREAEMATPSPEGWAAITARVSHDDLADRRERRQHRTRGVVAALVATGTVAATVIFALGIGFHRSPDPSTPTPSPTSTVQFDPSSPRKTWTIYRAGSDKLYADEVRATSPYDPAQAFTQLFSQVSTTSGPLGLEANGRNRVASLRTTSTAIVLDLDAADTTGQGSSRTAGLEAQAWLSTAHAAYNGSTLPLLVTLRGRPFTLFGALDTATPIKERRDVPTVVTQRVFLPEAGASVTSPVDIVGNPGAGDYDWVVTDATTGAQVWSDGASQNSGDGPIGFSADLPPGSYDLAVRPAADRPAGSPRNLFQSSFTVTGQAPASTQAPVTNPTTTDVPRVAVTWPARTGTGLVEEWRPRGSVADVLADLGDGPTRSSTKVLRPWAGARLSSVTTLPDRVVLDLPAVPGLRAPDQTTAHRWALTLVRAVQDTLGTDLPVQVTRKGQPTELFAWIDTTEPLGRAGQVAVQSETDLFTPTDRHWGTGEAVVVGAVAADTTEVTWYVIDPVSNLTLYQGQAALDANHTYGFRLPLPAGDYLFEISRRGGDHQRTSAYDLRVL